MVALSEPEVTVPLVGFVPAHPVPPPVAVQDVAPLELQERVVVPPEVMAEGLAVRLTCTALGVTVMGAVVSVAG